MKSKNLQSLLGSLRSKHALMWTWALDALSDVFSFRKSKLSKEAITMDWKTIVYQAVKILRAEEGWRGYIYDDYDGKRIEQGQLVKGYPTAMYGMTHFYNDLVPEEIRSMFPKWGDMGLAVYTKKIIDYDLLRFTQYLPHLNTARLVVLVCLIYQLGSSGVLGFQQMLQAILDDDWDEVAKEGLDSKWAKKDSPERAQRMMEIMRRGTLSSTTTS